MYLGTISLKPIALEVYVHSFFINYSLKINFVIDIFFQNLAYLILGAEGGGPNDERLLDVQKKLVSFSPLFPPPPFNLFCFF
jgi:hypothetical protein